MAIRPDPGQNGRGVLSTSGGERLGQRQRPADVEALGVVDALAAQELHELVVADELRHGLLAEALGDVDDRADDELVGAVGEAVGDELAVDLQVVERQVLEVVEGAEAGAEVVEREAAADARAAARRTRARGGCSPPRRSR